MPAMPLDFLAMLPLPEDELMAALSPEQLIMMEGMLPEEALSGDTGASPYATQETTARGLDEVLRSLRGGYGWGGGVGGFGGMGGLGPGGTSQGTGFIPTGDPGSATQYGGANVDIEDLLTRRGITGVPAAVRHLIRGARETDTSINALSNAISGSGFRTREEQARLYALWLAGRGNLAAPPGHSMHEVGRAFDINSEWLSANPVFRQWLLNNGFEFPVSGEPWHAEWQGREGQLNPPNRQPSPTSTTPSPSTTTSRRRQPTRQEVRRRR